MNRIISLEKDLHASKKEIDNLNKKYSNQRQKLEKMKSRFSALKVKENRRQKNEKKSGLNVRLNYFRPILTISDNFLEFSMSNFSDHSIAMNRLDSNNFFFLINVYRRTP